MTTPTKAEFLAAIRAVAAPVPDDLYAPLKWENFRADTPDPSTADQIKTIRDHLRKQVLKAVQAPAATWIYEDRFAARARLSTYQKAKWISDDKIDSYVYSRAHAHFVEDKGVKPIRSLSGLLQETLDTRAPSGVQWLLATLPAFLEYFHEPNAVSEAILRRKHIAQLAEDARAGDAALQRLADIAGNHGRRDRNFPKLAQQHLAQAERRISMMMHQISEADIPIDRVDRTARERLLLWRLWCGLRSFGVAVRPVAIKHLMLTDGVEHSIDDRAVESMLKRFSERTLGRSRLNTRYLFLVARGYDYREERDAMAFEQLLHLKRNIDWETAPVAKSPA